MKLTHKQKLVLETIKDLIEREKDNPTSYRVHKILQTEGHKVGSLKGTVQVVEALEKKELLKRDEVRKIYLIKGTDFVNMENIFSIPTFGLASCGDATAFAEDNSEGYIQVSKSLFRKSKPAKMFAVKALGDSMDKDDIADGDYVVFEKYENGESLEGEIVVAVINGMATIKRYKKFKGVIGLFPNSKNTFHQPIYLDPSDQVLIAGVFRRVLPVKYVSL